MNNAVTKLIAHPPPCVTSMDAPLLQVSPLAVDSWRLADAYEGTAIFGRSGSGKTSGSGAAIAKAFLRNGFGGIVLCAKPDEADNWEQYAKETGRSDSVIRLDGSGRWRFNFLEYEMQRDNIPPDVLAANLVSTLQSVVEVVGRASGLSAGSRGDIFWEKAAKMFLTMAVDLLYTATGRVKLGDIVDIITTAPQSMDELKSDEWKENSFCNKMLYELFATGGGVNPPDVLEIRRLRKFWTRTFPQMSSRTRSNIVTTLMTDLDPLLRGRMREIFSTDTNLIPEMTHDGAIIILDFPIKTWNETGVLAQLIFKYIWMRATERREITDQTRPNFLFADECQLFISSYDMEFQSTARSSRTCSVLLTQNLPSFYSRIGGDQPEHTVNALMGNLRTKIFHNNDCTTTNEWATELVGKETVWRESFGSNSGWSEDQNMGYSRGKNSGWSESNSYSSNTGINAGANRSANYSSGAQDLLGPSSFSYGTSEGRSEGESSSHDFSKSGGKSENYSTGQSRGQSGGRTHGYSEERDYAVEPHEFSTQLRTGGKQNGNVVTGVMLLPGRHFARNGKHWMQLAFKQ